MLRTGGGVIGLLERGSRLALRLAPPAFRTEWHREVSLTFRESCLAAQQRAGVFGLARNGVAELFDLIRAALRARTGRALAITGGITPRDPNEQRPSMRPFLDDVRSSWRRLIRQPRAVAGTVLLLALAIGVTSAMLAVVDAFLVRPAPFRDPSTLTNLALRGEDGSFIDMDYATARALRDSGIFEAVMPAVMNAVGTFETPSGPVHRGGAYASPGTFAMLGVSPLLGREFVAGEGREGNNGQVLLSESVWRDIFGADRAIVGKTIRIADTPLVVVGVMPASLRFPVRGNGIWRPFDLDAPTAGIARRRPVMFARRQANMPVAETERLATDAVSPLLKQPGRVEFRPFSAGLLDTYSRESLTALAVGVGLVFLVLCANVANLILARTSSRRHEFGVFTALGASRARLLRQVFLENAAVAACATALGLGLAYVLVAVAQNTLPEDLMWRTLNPLDLDFRAVAATSGVGAIALLVAGLPAAWFGTRADANESIRLASRSGTDTPASRRLTKALLIAEVAMAVALLAAAGLQMRSFQNLVNADRGLDSNRVLLASVRLPVTQFADKASQSATAVLLEERVRALPGVEKTTLASNVPPATGNIYFGTDVKPLIDGAASVRIGLINHYLVAPAFFETFGIQLREGRGFNSSDDANAAVLSERFARALFKDLPAVGERFTLDKETFHVVGVATEIRNSLTDPREDLPEFYQPWYRATEPGATGTVPGSTSVTIGLRCAGPCPSQAELRQAVESVSAAITVSDVHLLSADFIKQLARPRVAAIVAGVFSGLALFAAAAGLYGVLAYVVSRRRREFGIRAALGAEPSALRLAVIGDGLRVTSVGVLVGVAAGWTLSKWLASVQFGVTFFDPVTWAAVIAAVVVIAVIASWRPATRAMRVDPSEMLREP
jgi:putative ABC transport system permease protein